ncbi:phosphatase [Marinosulfonomonas sp. PRT-SC04]|nr:phosphatase [Marinosulfonomonas sp. PRT-SC04]
MSQIKAVLFDKDGTLFDFYATWGVWAKTLLLEESGGDAALAAQMGAAIGYDFDSGVFAKDSMVIFDTPPDIARALLPFFEGENVETLTARLNAAAAKVPQVEAVPLVPFLLGLEARGIKLGVATNDGQAPARAHLEAAGIAGMFDFIAGSDSGFGCKPASGMQEAFAAHLGLQGAEIAMVGDSVHDLVAGRAAGMVTVAVLTGVADHDELAPYADVVLPDIGHLAAWL